MTDLSLYVGLGGWLGAILDRLRSNKLPIPEEVSEETVATDASRFGALQFYRVHEWTAHRAARVGRIDEYLTEIHRRVRGQPWEEALWDGLFMFIPTPLAAVIALDLADRGIGRGWLAHSWQEEEVWWRLVDEYPEAVHNLVINRYTSNKHDWEHVEEVLHQFPWWDEVITMLVKVAPSSAEKARHLAGAARSRGLDGLVAKVSRGWHPAFHTAWETSA